MTLNELREATKDMPGNLDVLRASNGGYEAISVAKIEKVINNFSETKDDRMSAIVLF